MKMPNLLTEGNTITNVEQFKAYLSEVEMTDNFKSYLESLLNHLNNSTYTNKDEVINAITQALVKDEQVELSNKEALEKMQQYNDDLKRINIISTSLHDNDSKKDIAFYCGVSCLDKQNDMPSQHSQCSNNRNRYGNIQVAVPQCDH
jgi:hypothetical protein